MFLLASVILFTGGSLYDVTSCLADWSYVPSGGSVSLVPCSFWGSLSGGSLSGDLCTGVSLSRGSLSRRVSFQGSLCPGGVSVWGRSLSRGVSVQGCLSGDPLGREPPSPHHGYERAVRILLKSFLVSACVLHFQINLCRSKNRHLPRKKIIVAGNHCKLYGLRNSVTQ